MSNSNNNNGFWPLMAIVFVIAVIIQMIAGNNSSSTTSTAPPADTGSFEYRYAKERFKQEGFNNSDADTAARAVIKFHEAQKARGQ